MKNKLIIPLLVLLLICGCKQTVQEDTSSIDSSSESSLVSTESSQAVSEESSKEPATETAPPIVAVPESSSEPEESKNDAESAESAPAEKAENVVTVSVKNGSTTILASTNTAFSECDTPLLALQRLTKENKIQLDFSGSGSTAYVKAIGNVYEFDEGPESGWMVRVNGVFISVGSGNHKLNSGDVVEWLYTKDMGKDIGASFG